MPLWMATLLLAVLVVIALVAPGRWAQKMFSYLIAGVLLVYISLVSFFVVCIQ